MIIFSFFLFLLLIITKNQFLSIPLSYSLSSHLLYCGLAHVVQVVVSLLYGWEINEYDELV
jgi:uncharacterized membrane protein (DUF485 family)